jgi:hypothetical protein
MAGLKISALPAGTELADTDLIPYVDVSDTSEAPTGTTKYMEKSLLAIPSIVVESGIFDPAPVEIAGLTTITGYSGKYTKIGDIVTGGCLIRTILSGASASYNFQIPIECSDVFANGKQIIFAVSCNTPTDEFTEYAIQSETGTNQVVVTIVAAGTVTIEMYIMFTYSITL